MYTGSIPVLASIYFQVLNALTVANGGVLGSVQAQVSLFPSAPTARRLTTIASTGIYNDFGTALGLARHSTHKTSDAPNTRNVAEEIET